MPSSTSCVAARETSDVVTDCVGCGLTSEEDSLSGFSEASWTEHEGLFCQTRRRERAFSESLWATPASRLSGVSSRDSVIVRSLGGSEPRGFATGSRLMYCLRRADCQFSTLESSEVNRINKFSRMYARYLPVVGESIQQPLHYARNDPPRAKGKVVFNVLSQRGLGITTNWKMIAASR